MIYTEKYTYQVKTILKLTKIIKEESREVVLGTHIYVCIVRNLSVLFKVKMQNWNKMRIQMSVLCHRLLVRMVLEKNLVVILIWSIVIPLAFYFFNI